MTETILTTPTGMLVYDGEALTPEWFLTRRNGITGTDLPKILGLSQYGNTLSVVLDKRGELPPDEEANEAAEWGHVLEDPVAQEWARRNRTMVERIGILAHHSMPWMRASLDRVVRVCPDGEGHGVCGLEVKTRSAYKADQYRDDVPDDVLAQVAWSRAVSGFHHMHTAVLIGGQKLKQFRYDRDDDLEGYLLKEALPVWQAVVDGTIPVVDPSPVLVDLLNALYKNREGDRVVDLTQAMEHMTRYNEGHAAEQSGKAVKARAMAGLVQMLDDGDRAVTSDGRVLFTYRAPMPGKTVSSDNLRRLELDKPELFAHLVKEGYVTPTKPGPRFNATWMRSNKEKS